jgi:hypothetical protein
MLGSFPSVQESAMPHTKTVRRHVDLLEDAAGIFGIDLQDAAIRGTLQMDEIADAVLRCTSCSDPDACEGLVKSSHGAAPSLPPFCQNIVLFQRASEVMA